MSKIFSKSDLANLQNIPVATALLANLVLCTETGIMGLYDAENMAVLTLGGDIVPIHEHVLIAHSYHLYHEDCLSDWQHAIVDREIVQPFKQVFRELYLLTPAEEETGTYSSRFAGHVINPVIALKLFQTNNWQASRGIHTLPHKVFREQKIEAQFEFDDLQRYFHPNETSLTGLISFHPYAVQPPARNLETIRLIDVPPLIFSEVMRDADLVVSVAGTGEQQQSSAEIIMARVNLLSALLQSLKLTNLHIEGHFAYIKGKLANYRIHLGSAVIHIEPGNYLCIVPAEWKPSTTLYLPFADDNDRKTSEVISKVFMLLRDDKITDKSILAQIKRHQP